MKNTLKKRAMSLLLAASTLLGTAPAVLPKAAAAAADDVASKAVIKVGDTYTLKDSGPKQAYFLQNGGSRNVWPMSFSMNDGVVANAYCMDHSKTNPGGGTTFTVTSKPNDMRLYGVITASDARNTRAAFINTWGNGILTDDNFNDWAYFCASQAAVWAALGEVQIAANTSYGVTYESSTSLGYRASGKTLSAGNTTHALTLYAATQMLKRGVEFDNAWGPNGKGHAPYIGANIFYSPGALDFDPNNRKNNTIDLGNQGIVGSGVFVEQEIDGTTYLVLPMAAASATFIRGYQITVRLKNAPQGALLITNDNTGGTTRSQTGGHDQTLVLNNAKRDDTLYNNANNQSFGQKFTLAIPRATAEAMDAAGKKLDDVELYATLRSDRYNVYVAQPANGAVQPAAMVEPAVQIMEMSMKFGQQDPTNDKAKLRILKTDKNGAPLAGCTFQITYQAAGQQQTKEATTDGNGEVLFINLPINTDVTIKETAAPAGYQLLPAKVVNTGAAGGKTLEYTFANSDDHTFKVHKTSSADGRNLMGAKYEVKGIDNNFINTYTTDALGEFTIQGRDLPIGSFEVYEIAAPEGFATNGEVQTFSWDNTRDIQLSFKNAPLPGIQIYKYDKETLMPLEGATFEIRRDGQVLQTVRTDINGYARMTNLPRGFYQVVEVNAPAGYLKDEVVHEVYIDPAADPTHVVREVNVSNTKKLSIRIVKIDKETKIPLSGWKFDVFFNDAHLTSVTTNQDGMALLEDLQPGTYRIRETDGDKEHYNMDAPEQTIELHRDQADIPTLVFENTIKKHFGIYKIDSETRRPIEGVTFEIWRNGTLLGNYTTDAQGRILLPYTEPGTYQAKEINTDPRYVLNTETFTIENNAQYPTYFTIPNERKKDITVKKIDKDTGRPMQGVVFEGFKDGQSIGMFTTGADGSFVIGYADPGTYKFVERHTLAGYELSTEVLEAEHTALRDLVLTMENTVRKSFFIRKVDSQDKTPLAGVQFKVWRDGQLLGDYVTDANGRIEIKNALPGTYKAQETATLQEYVLNDQPVEIEHTTDKETVLTIENTKKPRLVIRKVDSVVGSGIKGAKFEIFVADAQNGTYKRLKDGYYFSDENGEIVLENADTGWYKAVEVEPAEGYELANPAEQTVFVEAGKTATLTFENVPKSALIIVKEDAGTGKPLAGAWFRVRYLGGTSGTGGTTIGEYKTGTNGSVVVTGLKAGTYVVEEISAPNGYVLSAVPQTVYLSGQEQAVVTVRFDNKAKGSLILLKKDAVTGAPLSGVEFLITDSSGTLLGNNNGKFVTDYAGMIRVDGLDPDTTVTAVEQRAKDGYMLDDTPQSIKIKSGETVTLEFLNQPKSSLLIVKKDAVTGAPLAGVEFLITDSEGAVIGNSNGKYTTDYAGTIRVDGLTPGMTIIAKETRTIPGYILDGTAQTVKIKENSVTTLEFLNKPEGGLIIRKVDGETKQPLPGAEFKITTSTGAVVDADGGLTSTNGIYVTDSNGQIVLSQLQPETYIITETKAPDGYVLETASQTVRVNESDTQTITFVNHKAYGLQIRKTVKGTGEALAGAKFKVTKVTGELIGTYTSNSAGLVNVSGIEDGVYVVQEISAPEGYRLDSTPQNVIVKAGELATVEFENAKLSSVRIRKIDAVTRQPISGVRFFIKDSKGKLIGEYTTDSDGYIELSDDLEEGKYYVEEVAAAPGYIRDEQQKTFRVRRGETTEIVWENTPQQGQIQITKKSKDDNPINGLPAGTLLQGATFEIYDKAGNVVDTIVSNERGLAVSKPLPLGRYTIKETKAPAYYGASGQTFEAEIEFASQIVRLEVLNESVYTNVSIAKSGPKEVVPGMPLRWTVSHIANNSTVPLQSFYWRDTLPYQAVQLDKIVTGTYNARLSYKIVYRTNLNREYRTLADNLSTAVNRTIQANPTALGLASGEVVTDFMLVFGTVPAGFRCVDTPYVFGTVRSSVAGTAFVNKADVGGLHNQQWIMSNDAWTTSIYRVTAPTLPKTGW